MGVKLPRLTFARVRHVEHGNHMHLGLALREVATYRGAIREPTPDNWEQHWQASQQRREFEQGRGR